MSNTYSLDDLRTDLDNQYEPLRLEVAGEEFILRNLFRCDTSVRKAAQDKLKALQKKDDNEERDVDLIVSAIEDLMTVIVADKKGAKLVKHIGGDETLLAKVLQLWIEKTKLGEASSSPA